MPVAVKTSGDLVRRVLLGSLLILFPQVSHATHLFQGDATGDVFLGGKKSVSGIRRIRLKNTALQRQTIGTSGGI